MREEDSNWFSKWEEELPTQEELMPLSQTLITPDLAFAFDIRNRPGGGGGNTPVLNQHRNNNNYYGGGALQQQQQSSSTPQPPPTQHNSSEYDEMCCASGSGIGGGGSGSGADESARTLKRPRLVWTPQLHKRFVDAVAHLGIKNAVPKTIMHLMSVDGLTRENVASHLQKYRLYLKRMQGINNGGSCTGGGNGSGSGDPATDHLFASSPVPAHFLHQVNGGGVGGGGRLNSDQFMSYIPMTALHHQQMVAGHQQIPAQAQAQTPTQAQYAQHHRQMGQFVSTQSNGQFDHPFLSRQAQLLGPNRNGNMLQNNPVFVEDLESNGVNNSRKVLTLFPSSDD